MMMQFHWNRAHGAPSCFITPMVLKSVKIIAVTLNLPGCTYRQPASRRTAASGTCVVYVMNTTWSAKHSHHIRHAPHVCLFAYNMWHVYGYGHGRVRPADWSQVNCFMRAKWTQELGALAPSMSLFVPSHAAGQCTLGALAPVEHTFRVRWTDIRAHSDMLVYV